MSSIHNFSDGLQTKATQFQVESWTKRSNTSSSALTSFSTISAYNPNNPPIPYVQPSKRGPLEFNPKLAHMIQEKRSSIIEALIKVRDADEGDVMYPFPAHAYKTYELPLWTVLKREGYHLESSELERYTLVLDVLDHNYPRLQNGQPEYHAKFETFLRAQEPDWEDYASSPLSHLNLLDARNQMHNYVQDCVQKDKDFSKDCWSYFFLATSALDPTGISGIGQFVVNKIYSPKAPFNITKGDVLKVYPDGKIPSKDFEGVAKLGLDSDADQVLKAAMGKATHENNKKTDDLESGLSQLEKNFSLFSERLKQLEDPQIKKDLKKAEQLPHWKHNCAKALKLAEAVTHSFSVYAQKSQQAFAEREHHRHVRSRMRQTTLLLKQDYSDLTSGRGAAVFSRNLTNAKEALQELNFQQKQMQSFLEQRQKLEADGADIGQALADLNQKLEESYRKMQKAQEKTNKFLRGAEFAVNVAAAAVSVYTGGAAAPAAAVGKGAFQAMWAFVQREQLKEATRLQNRTCQMEATSLDLHQARQDNQAHSQSLYYQLKNLSVEQLGTLQKDPRLFSFYQQQLDAYKVLVTQKELDPTVKKIQTCEQELEQLKAAKETAERGLSPFTGKASTYEIQMGSGTGHSSISISLHNISLKDLKKQDPQLVQKHAKDVKAIKSIVWNKECGVVIIEKNGKFRVYQLGGGAHPAIFEHKNRSTVLDFVNNRNQQEAHTTYQTAQARFLQKEVELQDLLEKKKNIEDEIQDVEAATQNAQKAQGVKAVTAEYLDSGLCKFLDILYGPSDDPRQQAIDEGLEKITLYSKTGKDLVINVLQQLNQFAPVFDRFIEGSNFQEKMLPEGFNLAQKLHKPSLVLSKIATICEGLYNIQGAYKLHSAGEGEGQSSQEKPQASSETDSGKLEALAHLAKVGAGFIHPAIPVVMASLELVLLLKEEEQQLGPHRIETLGNDLRKLNNHMIEGIREVHTHLHAVHKDIAEEFGITQQCLEIVQEQLTHELRTLKETIHDVNNRHMVIRKYDLVRLETRRFRSQPHIGNCIDYTNPTKEISLDSNTLRCVLRAFKTQFKEMETYDNTGLWLSQDTGLSLSPLNQGEIVARHPEYVTGFLGQTLGVAHAPSFYHYEQYTYMFCRFAAMAIRRRDHERYQFQEEITELSITLIYKGRALQQVLSTEVLQYALEHYQANCSRLLSHLQQEESQLIRRRERLLVEKGKEWLGQTSVLKAHYSGSASKLEVKGSRKFSFLKFLIQDPIRTKDIQRIAHPQAYDHMLSFSDSPLVQFWKQEGFWGSVQAAYQTIIPLGGVNVSYDIASNIQAVSAQDEALIKERRRAIATLSKEVEKLDEKPPIAWLNDESVQKIDGVQRDLITGNFLEVAYAQWNIGDRRVALSNHASKPRPLHSHLLFPKGYYLSQNLEVVIHKCTSKHCCWDYERAVSHSKIYSSESFSYGAYFSLIQTQSLQNSNGLKGRTFFFVSSALRKTFTRLSCLSSLLTQVHLKQLSSTGGLYFDFQGREHKKMLTSPDGACALHALLGTLTTDKGYHHKGVRGYFVKRLRLRMQEYHQSNAQPVPPHLQAIKEQLAQIIKEHLDRAVDPQGNDPSSLMLFPRSQQELLLYIPHSSYDEWTWMSQRDTKEFRKSEFLSVDSGVSDVDEAIEVETSSYKKTSFSEVQSILEGIEDLDDIKALGDTRINEDIHEWVYLPLFQFMRELGKSEQRFIKQRIKTLLLGSSSKIPISESKRFFERVRKYLSEYGPIETLTNLQLKTYCAAALNARLKTKSLGEAKEHYLISVMRKTTLLHMAATDGSLDVVVLILEKGAEINMRDKDGRTALERAVISGHSDVALFLMLYGADDASVLNVHQILSTFQVDQQTISMYTNFSKAVNALAPGANRLHLAINVYNAYAQNPSLLKSVKIAILFLARTTLIHQADTAGNVPIDMLDKMNFPIHLKNKGDERSLPLPEETLGKETLEKMPELFWEILGIPKERVAGIKIVKCWQLLKAAQKKARDALKEKEATLWLDELKDQVLSKVLEKVQHAKRQDPLYKKTEEEVLKMLHADPKLLLNIVYTEREEFFKLVKEEDSKKKITEIRKKQEELHAQQEKQLHAFALSKTVYERYLTTVMRETQSDQDPGFYFNTQEIHLAALLFDKKAQVVAKHQGTIVPVSSEFNAYLPSTSIIIYHEANHFSRCDPTATLDHSRALQVIQTPAKEKAYDQAIQGLVKDYAEFVEKHLQGEVLIDKSDNVFEVLGDKDHKFQLLPPLENQELLPLAFPQKLMGKIEDILPLRDIVGIPVPYYTFQLNSAKECYELCIEYQVFAGSKDTCPKEYCTLVVAQIGVDVVEAFHLVDAHLIGRFEKQYKMDLSHNEFLIQAMYTHLSKELGLPGKETSRGGCFERNIVATEGSFEGLFKKLQTAPTEKVRIGYNPDPKRGELEFFENQLELRAKHHYSLIQKELLLKRNKQATERQKLDIYKKAKEGQYLVEALLKIGAQTSVLHTFKEMTNPDTMVLVPETIQDRNGEPTHKEKAEKICLEVVKEHAQHPSLEREYLESHLANLALIQEESEAKESKEQFTEILDDAEPFSDYAN